MRTCLKQNTFIVTKNNFSFPLETFITDEYYEADDDDNNEEDYEDLPELVEGNEEDEELFDDQAFFHEQNDVVDNSNDDDSDSSLSSSSNSSISSAALKDGKGNPSVDLQGTKQQMMIATAAKTASEEAQQLQRTTSGTTKRSTKIAGFEVKESNKSLKEFESAEYISQESIARAIMKPCCTEECLRKKLNTGGGYSCLNFESVYSKILAARKHLFGNEFKDKVTILKAIIQGTLCSSILHYFY